MLFYTSRNFCVSVIQDLRNSKPNGSLVITKDTKKVANELNVQVKDIKVEKSKSVFANKKIKTVSIL